MSDSNSSTTINNHKRSVELIDYGYDIDPVVRTAASRRRAHRCAGFEPGPPTGGAQGLRGA